ncbi:MAG: hypothetical protein RBT41_11450 [Clostridia bacterium]|nr:hypothetical protein [Clostridia bacterium]
MIEEKKRILEMIQEGKITSKEGLDLLEALESGEDASTEVDSNLKRKFLRIKVYTDKAVKVNINIPLALVKVASRFGAMGLKYIPEEARTEMERKGIDLSQIDIEELVAAIEQGLIDEKLVDVDVDDPKEGKVRVEVYVD